MAEGDRERERDRETEKERGGGEVTVQWQRKRQLEGNTMKELVISALLAQWTDDCALCTLVLPVLTQCC